MNTTRSFAGGQDKADTKVNEFSEEDKDSEKGSNSGEDDDEDDDGAGSQRMRERNYARHLAANMPHWRWVTDPAR